MGDAEEDASEWAAEVVFELYTSHGGEYNIYHNVHCDHKASVFDFELAGTTVSIKQNRDGAITMARYLEVHGSALGLSQESRVLELGSGTGLLGIALNVCLGVRNVHVTDKEEMLKLLRQNVKENRSSATVSELVWGYPIPPETLPVDFVLAADCIYHDSLVPPFVQALADCSTPDTVVLISFELRDSEVLECFFEHAHAVFECEQLPKEDIDIQYGRDGVAIFRLKKRARSS